MRVLQFHENVSLEKFARFFKCKEPRVKNEKFSSFFVHDLDSIILPPVTVFLHSQYKLSNYFFYYFAQMQLKTWTKYHFLPLSTA